MRAFLNKTMIVDGSYLLHRSLHTPGLQELCTVTGMKTGGVYGSLKILQAELKRFPEYFPIVCFDDGLSKRRTDLYPDYKANRARQEADSLAAVGVAREHDDYLEEYHRQRADLIAILKSFGIPSLLIPGWEGDDLQYLLTLVSKESVVISDDKDLIQLVAPNVKIRRSMRDETITWDESDEYYRAPRFTIRKAIVGDPSDNIPKCANGLGEKGADEIAKMLQIYNEGYYKTCLEKYCKEHSEDKICKKIEALLGNWEQFEVNYQLIDLQKVEIPYGFESLIKDILTANIGRSNIMESYSLIGRYEMNSVYPDQILAMLSLSSSHVIL